LATASTESFNGKDDSRILLGPTREESNDHDLVASISLISIRSFLHEEKNKPAKRQLIIILCIIKLIGVIGAVIFEDIFLTLSVKNKYVNSEALLFF
jgi:hypothetical protein